MKKALVLGFSRHFTYFVFIVLAVYMSVFFELYIVLTHFVNISFVILDNIPITNVTIITVITKLYLITIVAVPYNYCSCTL